MKTGIHFRVLGIPTGKGRPRSTRTGRMYTPAKTRDAEESFAAQAASAMSMNGLPLFTGPVKVECVIYCPIPASWSRKKREEALSVHIMPTTKPDLDNVTKLVLDAMNGIVYLDDKQVVQQTFRKEYGETPGYSVTVQPW